MLPDGYSDVPPGKLAAVVTCLEMRAAAAPRAERADPAWTLRRVEDPDPDWYRDLYRRVGLEWLWFSRLALPTAGLRAIIGNARVEVYALRLEGRDEGLLELDFRIVPECELAFFGLTGVARGRGAGRWLMNRAVERAWAHAIARLWVHTCTLDHPGALDFYLRSGFLAYARRVEVADDPRLIGLAPRDAAPHIPIVESLSAARGRR
ncbi:MAG TPA: GNAT family N-acetyltransferase [Steroidobacteraceae bacterium]|nr:GNAT family N-acetyltransferase [Steroidobacteraceae bacterium]